MAEKAFSAVIVNGHLRMCSMTGRTIAMLIVNDSRQFRYAIDGNASQFA